MKTPKQEGRTRLAQIRERIAALPDPMRGAEPQGTPECRVGISIYDRHDIGADWKCTRCGWQCPVPSILR